MQVDDARRLTAIRVVNRQTRHAVARALVCGRLPPSSSYCALVFRPSHDDARATIANASSFGRRANDSRRRARTDGGCCRHRRNKAAAARDNGLRAQTTDQPPLRGRARLFGAPLASWRLLPPHRVLRRDYRVCHSPILSSMTSADGVKFCRVPLKDGRREHFVRRHRMLMLI